MTNIIDHVGISVTDFDKSRAFYVAALGTLGIKVIGDFSDGDSKYLGFGKQRPTFWVGTGKMVRGEAHIAFIAGSRSEVESFYTAALANGGRDHGKPGLRPHYHADYYAAYVLDPDGHNVEAVYHGD